MGRRYTNLHSQPPHGLWQILQWKLGLRGPARHRTETQPAGLPAVVPPDLERLRHPDPEAIQATWIGHATFLIQMGGRNVLIDPVFASHCAPVPLPRLRRKRPPGVPIDQLPPIDLVCITHSHFDHLDLAALRRLPGRPLCLVPSGLSRWLARQVAWEVREVAWWAREEVAPGWSVHAVPAQHFTARTWWDRNRSHWCGWVIAGPGQRVYAMGDSGYCPEFAEIGERLGPMDLALLSIGAYEPRWLMQTMHLNPEESVQAHRDVRSRQSLAGHWGTFDLTDEPMGEPPERLRRALRAAGLPESAFQTPALGETVVLRGGT